MDDAADGAPKGMTVQKEHIMQGSTDGWRNKSPTPRISIYWRMMQQIEHTI